MGYSDADREQAEAERQRASDAYNEVSDELAEAEELLSALEDEDIASPTRSATREAKIRIIDTEVHGLREDLEDAEADLTRAIERWDEVHR